MYYGMYVYSSMYSAFKYYVMYMYAYSYVKEAFIYF